MTIIRDLNDLVDRYRTFIFDVWGVLHDGEHAYSQIINMIKALQSENKIVLLLSNSPKRLDTLKEILKKMNIDSSLFDAMMSSGEACYHPIIQNKLSKRFGHKQHRYYFLGDSYHKQIHTAYPHRAVSSISEADYILLTSFFHINPKIEEYDRTWEEALAHNCPVICLNPDKSIFRQNGEEVLSTGSLAERYEALGGEVFYIGKPYPDIYAVFKASSVLALDHETLMIGDTLETDIQGALTQNIDSVLVKHHARGEIDIKTQNIIPTYTLMLS